MLSQGRDIEVVAEARVVEGWLKEVTAGQPSTGQSFTFRSDEGPYMPGGAGTAPTPLTYFVAGIALWLLSHVSQVAIKRKLTLHNERVKVTGYFREEGSVRRGDAHGWNEGFIIELSMESEAPTAEIAELMRLAHRMCFTEDVLGKRVTVNLHHTLNGKAIEVETR